MSDIPEAIGTATEGGLYARAISAGKGDGSVDASGHFAEDACLNCGTELIGRHCHHCGQKAHLHRTLSAVGHDLIHGVLHLDGKLWRTLPLLTLHPGRLTRRYIDGERADFVSPMALFLFAVFLMFAVFQAIGFTTPTDIDGPDMAQLDEELVQSRAALVEEREGLTERLGEASGPQAARIQSRIEEIDGEIEGLDTGRAVIIGDGLSEDGATITVAQLVDGVPIVENLAKKWQENPGLMLYKLQANSYKFSWLLIPLSLPFVWLLFAWRPQYKAYDHAIFVTYSLAFMSLLFIAVSLLGKLGFPSGALALAGLLVPPVHIYRQLRGAYELSRWSAAWRTMALSWVIIFIVMIFLQILLVLGAF